MPAANPLTEDNIAVTNGSLASGATMAGQTPGAGSGVNITVAVIVILSGLTLVALHALGFRFAFDVSVGRR
jgi:hypothetical protein